MNTLPPKSDSPHPPRDETTVMSGSPTDRDTPAEHRHASPDSPSRLGPYRLLEQVGSGGMGQVWKAERTEPVHQIVAIKQIRLGLDTRHVLARFDAERQTLARMEHPNIAKVFDAGTGPDGRPFFVMEYVRGLPLHQHCDRYRLALKERLRLFVQVCEGIQHAHQKGIIHRDLKPGNILVEQIDGRATPKIIDFGIAKATEHDLGDETRFTIEGQLVGTPEYMSPEQAALAGQDVDTRSDVYALGVLLYELLTGALPFDPKSLRQAGWAEVQRIICEVDPPRPSTRLDSVDAEPIARSRSTRLRRLAQDVRGDLDWIVLRCLEKDRARRYASVSELAADIGRHLEHRPVEAGPPSAVYRLRKFVRRNRALVTTLGTVSVVLVLAVIGMSILSNWALRERARAEAGRARAEAITDFVTGALISTDPNQGGTHDFTVRAAMDQALQLLDGGALAEQPDVEARLRLTISEILDGNADSELAVAVARQALEISRSLHARDHAAIIAGLNGVGACLFNLGRYADALTSFEEALAMDSRLDPEPSLDRATHYNTIACCLLALGRIEDALVQSNACLDIRKQLMPPDSHRLAASYGNTGAVLLYMERHEEALPYFEEGVRIFERLYQTAHPSLAQAYNNVGCCLRALKRFDEALPTLQSALEMKQNLFPGDHPEVSKTMNNVGICLRDQGNLQAALSMCEAALSIDRRLHSGDHPALSLTLSNLGSCLFQLGRTDEAVALYEEAVAIERRLYPAGHPDLIGDLQNLANALDENGRTEEAARLRQEADGLAD